ncbi:LysR family transcriptional regulator [Streptomyces olivaceoviridis]|uniref:LysR family transcriptional regulator n=1 Tax=Streptomyces olivaceoviridis TaxID=1921 RepID=UPI0036B29661
MIAAPSSGRSEIPPRLLRAFLTVAQERHFGRAAARLAIAQPALSRQIQQLERQLGLVLFSRTARGAVLTAAGECLLPEAERALEQHEHVLRVAAMLAGTETSTVRLAVPMPLPVEGLLTEAIRRFRADFPQVRVEVLELPDHEQATSLAHGRTDLALAWDRTDVPGLIAESLLAEQSYAVVPADHALADAAAVGPAELSAYQVLFPVEERSHCWELLRVAARKAKAEIHPVPTAPAAVLDLVRSGLGVSVVPSSLRAGAGAGLVFVPVTGLRYTMSLLRRQSERSPAVQRFVAQTRDAAALLVQERGDVWSAYTEHD